jgi:hypothetical protein
VGGSLPEASGGAVITEYVVAFNQLSDFSGIIMIKFVQIF